MSNFDPLLYVASRASLPERPAMWRAMRDAGWRIVSSWIDEAGEGETASFADLWHRIEDEVRRSDGLILYAERDDFPLKGALIEVGHGAGDAQTCRCGAGRGRSFPGAAVTTASRVVAAPREVPGVHHLRRGEMLDLAICLRPEV